MKRRNVSVTSHTPQRAKKVVSDSPGLVDFAIGLVNSVFNLPDGQVIYFEEFEKQKNCEINSAGEKAFGLVEMTSGLVNVSFSLPEWQAVKMIFFATCSSFYFLESPGSSPHTLSTILPWVMDYGLCGSRKYPPTPCMRSVEILISLGGGQAKLGFLGAVGSGQGFKPKRPSC